MIRPCSCPSGNVNCHGARNMKANAHFAMRQLTVAQCRYGSLATNLRWSHNVRFSLDSDRIAVSRQSMQWANIDIAGLAQNERGCQLRRPIPQPNGGYFVRPRLCVCSD
jgi:hypothetical protein